MNQIVKKICNKCKFDKSISEFSFKKKNKDGLNYTCNLCVSNYDKNRYNPVKSSIQNKIYRNLNSEKEQKRKKKYIENNRDKVNKYAKTYRSKNKEKFAYRYVLINTLKRLGKPKEGHSIDLLGYSAIDLKQYIESLFTEEMSWDNYGEWHIDHIKRIIDFDDNTHPSIVNALSNLRPLWATTREINGIIYEGNLNRLKA